MSRMWLIRYTYMPHRGVVLLALIGALYIVAYMAHPLQLPDIRSQQAAIATGMTGTKTIDLSKPLNKQCPDPDDTHGYNPKLKYQERYKDGTKMKSNLYGKPCIAKMTMTETVNGRCFVTDYCHGDTYVGPDGKTHPLEPTVAPTKVTDATDKTKITDAEGPSSPTATQPPTPTEQTAPATTQPPTPTEQTAPATTQPAPPAPDLSPPSAPDPFSPSSVTTPPATPPKEAPVNTNTALQPSINPPSSPSTSQSPTSVSKSSVSAAEKLQKIAAGGAAGGAGGSGTAAGTSPAAPKSPTRTPPLSNTLNSALKQNTYSLSPTQNKPASPSSQKSIAASNPSYLSPSTFSSPPTQSYSAPSFSLSNLFSSFTSFAASSVTTVQRAVNYVTTTLEQPVRPPQQIIVKQTTKTQPPPTQDKPRLLIPVQTTPEPVVAGFAPQRQLQSSTQAPLQIAAQAPTQSITETSEPSSLYTMQGSVQFPQRTTAAGTIVSRSTEPVGGIVQNVQQKSAAISAGQDTEVMRVNVAPSPTKTSLRTFIESRLPTSAASRSFISSVDMESPFGFARPANTLLATPSHEATFYRQPAQVTALLNEPPVIRFFPPSVDTVGTPTIAAVPTTSFGTFINHMQGGWVRGALSRYGVVQLDLALAIARSNEIALQAQIHAWNDARDAGLCDSVCESSLVNLNTGVSVQRSTIAALVARGADASLAGNADKTFLNQDRPTIAISVLPLPSIMVAIGRPVEIERTDDNPTIPSLNKEAASEWASEEIFSKFRANIPFATSGTRSTLRPPALPVPDQPVLLHAITNVWQTLTGFLRPNEAAAPSQFCTVLMSIFGSCFGLK